jgi:hypothetical protein
MGIVRRRARRRVLIAGAATGAAAYHAGKKHGARNQEAYDEQYDAPPGPSQATQYAPAPPVRTGPDAADIEQIQKLAALHDAGALTDDEFAAAKSKLLA